MYISARKLGSPELIIQFFVDEHSAERMFFRGDFKFYNSLNELKDSFEQSARRNLYLKRIAGYMRFFHKGETSIALCVKNWRTRTSDKTFSDNGTAYFLLHYEEESEYGPNLFRVDTFLTQEYIDAVNGGVFFYRKGDVAITVDGDNGEEGIANSFEK